jgi:hypothetical protein
MVMTLGYSPAGVLHVHGAVTVLGAIAAAPDDMERITAALEAAGGQWASARGDHHQIVLRPMYDADGWARYLNGNRIEAEPALRRGRAWSMTNAARREAQAQYDGIRRSINAARCDKEESMAVWPGLTRETMEEIGERYAAACIMAMERARERHPDDSTAFTRMLVELRRGIHLAVSHELLALGCPSAECDRTLQSIIGHDVKHHMNEARKLAESESGSCAVN